MAVKTIAIDMEAYELLSRHKRGGLSFSKVIKKHFGPQPTAARLREWLKSARLSEATLGSARGGEAEGVGARGETMIHFDSSFLIDLQRELVRERPGAAFDLIESFDAGEILGVSVHVVCELRAGAELTKKALAEHEAIDRRGVVGNAPILRPSVHGVNRRSQKMHCAAEAQ